MIKPVRYIIANQKNNGIFKVINKSFIFCFLERKMTYVSLILKVYGVLFTNSNVVFTTCA